MQISRTERRATGTAVGPEERTILVVDDDRLIVATIGQRLRGAGYRVLEAFDGPSALALCASAPPDLAIVDYLMPGMTGVELARELARSGGVPVIFLSAYSDDPIVSDAIGAGALTYVVKPIDTEQLLPVVRTALRRGREIKALQQQNERLLAQLSDEQNISTATGFLMATLKIGRREAFERLRHKARSRRMKLQEVATEYLRTCDESNRLLQDFAMPVPPSDPSSADST
jgi:response regulator NasT